MPVMTQKGLTLVELVVVIAMLALLLAIAAPSFQGMRQNAQYRDSARAVANMFQEVRSLAIRDGIAHRIACTPGTASCELQRVAFDTGSNAFVGTTLVSFSFPTGVMMRTGMNCDKTDPIEIEFFPNGNTEKRAGPTASGSDPNAVETVCVNENAASHRFKVRLKSLTTGSVEIAR